MIRKDTIQSGQYSFSAVDQDGVKVLTEQALDYKFWKVSSTQMINFYADINVIDPYHIDYIDQTYFGPTDFTNGDPECYMYFTKGGSSEVNPIMTETFILEPSFISGNVRFNWQGSFILQPGLHRIWLETQARNANGAYRMNFLMRGRPIAPVVENFVPFEF